MLICMPRVFRTFTCVTTLWDLVYTGSISKVKVKNENMQIKKDDFGLSVKGVGIQMNNLFSIACVLYLFERSIISTLRDRLAINFFQMMQIYGYCKTRMLSQQKYDKI